MIRRAGALSIAALAGLALMLGLGSGPSSVPDGAVRGVALGLFAADPDYDYGPMLDEIADRGATDVLLAVAWYQASLDAVHIEPRTGHTPSDANVRRALNHARRRGLRPALLPIVRLAERRPGQWRGLIAPADIERWFASYRHFIERLATAAEADGAARLYVGSELVSIQRYEARWRQLITQVRARFGGTLSYSANWDAAADVGFWDALDEIGVTGYFPMPASGEPSALADAWRGPRRAIARLSARHRKPVVLTEVGYASRPSAAARPWDDGGAAPIDLDLQARLYDGFCAAWADRGIARGFYAWNWFGIGGPRDTGFSLRGKPAATRVTACLHAWVDPTTAAR